MLMLVLSKIAEKWEAYLEMELHRQAFVQKLDGYIQFDVHEELGEEIFSFHHKVCHQLKDDEYD